jgi:hypothetical protein
VDPRPCRYFSIGVCKNGGSCAFAHDIPQRETPSKRPPKNDTEAVEDSRAQIICKFYLRGECNNGNRCPYKHSEQLESQVTDGVEETGVRCVQDSQ